MSLLNEQLAAEGFSRQSSIFDKTYGGNTIIIYKRKRVREHLEKHLQPGSHILELNAGTGEDAIYFATKGHYVHATDIAEGMQNKLREKVDQKGLQMYVSQEICSFTQLDTLKHKGPYDCIFSNFAGLNCTDRLDVVLDSLAPLLRPGGLVTLVVLPKFCLWETLGLFKGKFRTATRRLFSRRGVSSHVEGSYFKCWYYNPGYIRQKMRPAFEVMELEGLCTLVPPSYMENFPEKHPRLYAFLVNLENRLKNKWPWKVVGDYYVITLKRV
jgi:ubiquinone/menaquinone biosynthesis C-methylase UbiE